MHLIRGRIFTNLKATYGGQLPPDAIAQLQTVVADITSQGGSSYSVPVCCVNTGGKGGVSNSCSGSGLASSLLPLYHSGSTKSHPSFRVGRVSITRPGYFGWYFLDLSQYLCIILKTILYRYFIHANYRQSSDAKT